MHVGSLGRRNPFHVDDCAAARTFEDVADVRCQSVRKIHHGMYFRPCSKPKALGYVRLWVAVNGCCRCIVAARKNIVQPCSRGAQFARDENRIACAGIAAAFDVRRVGPSDGCDVDDDAGGRSGRVAARERYAEPLAHLPITLHELGCPCVGRVRRQRERQQRCNGASAHRCHIAQVDCQRFAPQLAGRSGGTQKVDALGQQVGREEQRLAVADGQHGAVVADALEAVGRQGGESGCQLLDEAEFGHGMNCYFGE